MTARTATGKTLTSLTGVEDVDTLTLDTVKGASCAPENRGAVVELVTSAANKLLDTDALRAVAVRVAGAEDYTVFVVCKDGTPTADRRAIEKRLYG